MRGCMRKGNRDVIFVQPADQVYSVCVRFLYKEYFKIFKNIIRTKNNKKSCFRKNRVSIINVFIKFFMVNTQSVKNLDCTFPKASEKVTGVAKVVISIWSTRYVWSTRYS